MTKVMVELSMLATTGLLASVLGPAGDGIRT
jgi:hypothetical protein